MLRIPEYGHESDHAGARRARRSFRLCAAACVLFTIMLWISERYLRYELTESQYIAALTLEPESARAILRQVVKRDEATREFPTPKYLAALAEREEADLVLPSYAKAYEADPNNASLALRYGCRLFQAGDYAAARARFHESTAKTPENALPRYLEAATVAWTGRHEADVLSGDLLSGDLLSGDLGESLATVAKTNNRGDSIAFPQPVWAPAALPERGVWYSRLRRQIVDECCAPLYGYTSLIVALAKRQIELGRTQNWDAWLANLQTMGERLVESDCPGAIQATVGIRIQLAALEQREAIRTFEKKAPDPELDERRIKATSALDLLNDFEDKRDHRIAADKEKYKRPLELCWKSVAVVFVFYLLTWMLSKIARADAVSWSFPHSKPALCVLAAGCLLLLALLVAITALGRRDQVETSWLDGANTAWWVVVAVLLAFGVGYSALRPPGVLAVVRRHGMSEDDTETLKTIRKYRRDTCTTLMRRYYGLVLGLLLCIISLWGVGYRVLCSTYPWQIQLLTTGLMEEEAEVVARVLAIL